MAQQCFIREQDLNDDEEQDSGATSVAPNPIEVGEGNFPTTNEGFSIVKTELHQYNEGSKKNYGIISVLRSDGQ
jgi:hypothetical protein